MEREDSFHSCAHSITSSSSDLSSISSLSKASLGRPLCEYEEFCSPSSRSWASDESGALSRISSHSPPDADALQKELQELLEVREKLLDVWIIVNNRDLTDRARSWLGRVDNMVMIVNKSRQRRNATLLSSWWQNREVRKLREFIKKLAREGEIFIHAFSNTFSNMFDNVIDHEDTQSQSIFVGHEDILSQLEALLGSEENNIIGIEGPRGIGKTRILQEFLMLNEKSSSRIRFSAVFLTALFYEKPIFEFQKEIAERINLSLADNEGKEQRRTKLYNALSDMKFLLVLDEPRWAIRDLKSIGIPWPTTGSMSKIIVTSRSAEVWKCMRVDVVIHVPALSDEQSWELFRSLIRHEATEDAEAEEWGMELVRNFRGLPAAIIDGSMEYSAGSSEEWSSQFKYSGWRSDASWCTGAAATTVAIL